MRYKTILVLTLLLLSYSSVTYAEDDKKHFVSSSFFMLFNLLPNPPSFYQLNYGHRITKKDTIIVEAITWTYDAPLGIPYGASYGDARYKFDGYARDIGVGLAYQRFWWRGLYSTLHMTPFWQLYYDNIRDDLRRKANDG